MHNPTLFFPWLALLSLTFCCFLENTLLSLDENMWCRQMGTGMAEDDGWEKLFKKCHLFLALMESCFQSQRLVLFFFFFLLRFVFLLIELFSVLFHLQAQQKQDIPSYPVLWLRMWTHVPLWLSLVFFPFLCDVMVVSGDSCLFGLLSLYLLSSSGKGEENPMVPFVCMWWVEMRGFTPEPDDKLQLLLLDTHTDTHTPSQSPG